MPEQIIALFPTSCAPPGAQKSFQTLEMVLTSGTVSAAFGILIGVALTVTQAGSLMPNRILHQMLDKTINVFRSIPLSS